MDFITGLLNFSTYFAIAIAFLVVFKFIYTHITPYSEWEMIKDGKNTAAAIGFGGAVLGFAIAMSGVLSSSISIADFTLWSVFALIAQLIAFFVARFFLPQLAARIESGEVSAGIMLAVTSLSVGLINSAAMTY